MATWFTSDTHYGHDAIIRYCNRPYKSVGEMNFDMARRWNERVAPTDTVYHLGDFAMGDPERYPSFRHALQGQIVLVKGNHDKRMESVMAYMAFLNVIENAIIEVDGVKLWLNHYPLGVPDFRGRPYARPAAPGPYDIALCGHVHQNFKVQSGNVNVGVDVWDFAPISISDIRAAISSTPHARDTSARRKP
jgi:calcineurin-like phosphoesterase family protein